MYVYYLYPLIPKKFNTTYNKDVNTICERYISKNGERNFDRYMVRCCEDI